MTFFYYTFQGAATIYRWGGQIYNPLMLHFLRMSRTKKDIKIGWFGGFWRHADPQQNSVATFVQLQKKFFKLKLPSFRHTSSRCSIKQQIREQLCANKWAKFGAKIFMYFWEIAIFVLGRFILTNPVYTFFGNSPTGQTPEPILTRDGSKYAFSCNDVPFRS